MNDQPSPQPTRGKHDSRRPHMPSPDQYLAALGRQGEYKPPYGPLPPKRRWGKKVAAVLFLVSGLLVAYVVINLLRLSSNPFSFARLKGENEGRINILLLGVGDPGHAGQNLSDTNLVMSVNTKDKQVAFLSLPRDLRVYLPGYGYGKINQAHAQGGSAMAKKVVEQTLGIPIHYYAKANFTGLKEVVDAVGGVQIDVKETLRDPEYPCEKNPYRSCGMTIKKGLQHMNGDTALKYVRCRKGNCGDDFGRSMRQQEVLQAIRQKALSLGTILNPVKLNELSVALGDNVETDLSVNNVVSLAKLAKEVPPEETFNIVFNLEPGGFLSSSGGDLVPIAGNFKDLQLFAKDVFRLGPVWVENPTLVIENGTSTVGIASKLRDQIMSDGYRISVLKLTNAGNNITTSQIIDYTSGSKSRSLRYLESLLGVTAVTPPQPVKQSPADIKVILGSDYAGKVSSTDAP